MQRATSNLLRTLSVVGLLFGLWVGCANAQKKYDVGVTDTEIKIGNVMPYSGPASYFSAIGKTEAAYFRMINEQGGINGRRINFISYDDAYSPPKTVEQARKLIENDEVFLLFNIVGTPGNAAIQKYVNQKKIPHIFISSGDSRWNDPKNFPWSMAWWPSFKSEARVYAKYIQRNHPGKTVGILYQNDDFGKNYLAGLREIFGTDASRIIVAELPYELSTVSVDSQIVQIRAAKPDIFINLSTPKFAAQGIKKLGELGWKPIQFVSNVSQSVTSVMMVAGLENAQGIISAGYMKDPGDSQWANDQGMKEFRAFMTKYYPEGNQEDGTTVFGYGAAKTFAQVLRQCGDVLTRENIMKQMTSLNMEVNVYLPGIRIQTSPTNYSPIDQLHLMRFTGKRFELFGSVIDSK
jgi:branched-chain amino acid transport system substrate-binding protein